jgi:hypothetical protein
MCLAVLLLCFICPIATAQDQPPPTYSKDEIDNKLKGLAPRDEVESRLQDVYKRGDIDSKLSDLRNALSQDLRNALSQNASKGEVDARIGDLQKVFDATEKRNSEWRSDIEKRISTLENKSPPVSPWIAIVISLAALAMSGLGIYWSSRTSTNIAGANREETRRAAGVAKAGELVTEWQALSSKLSDASALFKNPDLIIEPKTRTKHLNLLVDLGNWYDHMAALWRNKTADAEALRVSGLRKEAVTFWDGVHIALGKAPELQEKIDAWDNLNWLVTTPNA